MAETKTATVTAIDCRGRGSGPPLRIALAALIAAVAALAVPAAAQASTEGSFNNFFGTGAGTNNTGTNNSFFGGYAGNANTTGADNSFFGRRAGYDNTTGAYNSFFGALAGDSNTTGNDNSFFGRRAGYPNTTGADNTFVGRYAGFSNTTGSGNTALGRDSDVTGNVDDATAIGHRAQVSQANSLVLGQIDGINSASGDTSVGIGTTAPDSPLHVESDNPTGASGNELLKLEQSNTGAVQDRALMLLQNKGGTRFQFDNTATSNSWRFQAGTGGEDNFEITKVGTGDLELLLDNAGNLDITGTLSQGSDRDSKRRITPVGGTRLLRMIAKLPIAEWTYKRDSSKARHLGPMAQDFHRLFGLGSDETKLAPGDLAGVAVAGVKAESRERKAEVRRLRAKVERQRRASARRDERQRAAIRSLRKEVRALAADRER